MLPIAIIINSIAVYLFITFLVAVDKIFSCSTVALFIILSLLS